MEEIQSPCVSICLQENGFCTGCGRTIEEIQHWWKYTNQEKQQVMDRIANDFFD